MTMEQKQHPKRRGRPPLPPEQRVPARVSYHVRLLPDDKALAQKLGTEWWEQQLARARKQMNKQS